jgi:hypothetical protein
MVAVLLALAACGSGTAARPPSVPSTVAAAASRPSTAAVAACLKAPASWMGCLVKADPGFGRLPLSQLALPGSHNAGTFNLDPESFDTQTHSACTAYKPADATLPTTLAAWSGTQDETITRQLDQGVRFLDLQVAYNGNGDALTGWRVVQSQFSDWPLYYYLDEIAVWAKAHPTEIVVVNLRSVCYDNRPTPAVAAGLWSSFATPSGAGGGAVTLAEAAYSAGVHTGSPATATLEEIVSQRGGGHNVVILLPNGLVASQLLTSRYGITPLYAVIAGDRARSGDLPMTLYDDAVAPTEASMFPTADTRFASYPLTSQAALGTPAGTGLTEVLLAYTFDPEKQALLFSSFGGLIQAAVSPLSKSSASSSGANRSLSGAKVATRRQILPAWEAQLWAPSGRNRIVAGWAHRVNVVLADGVENGGFIAAVISLNAVTAGG